MQPHIYEKQLKIPHYLGDRYRRITLPHLMNVLIEVSGEQTEEIGALSVREHGLSWVIIQYDLEIHRIPKTDEMIKVKTFAPINKQKNFTGTIKGIEAGVLILEVDGEEVNIPLGQIAKARLVPDLDW